MAGGKIGKETGKEIIQNKINEQEEVINENEEGNVGKEEGYNEDRYTASY